MDLALQPVLSKALYASMYDIYIQGEGSHLRTKVHPVDVKDLTSDPATLCEFDTLCKRSKAQREDKADDYFLQSLVP